MTIEDKVRLRMRLQARQETLRAGWQAFEREHIDDSSTTAERVIRRRAFFSGALAAYILTLSACGPEDESECDARLQALGEEVAAAIEELSL